MRSHVRKRNTNVDLNPKLETGSEVGFQAMTSRFAINLFADDDHHQNQFKIRKRSMYPSLTGFMDKSPDNG